MHPEDSLESVYDGLAAFLYQAYPPNRRLLPTGKAPGVVAVSRAVAASTLPPRPEERSEVGVQPCLTLLVYGYGCKMLLTNHLIPSDH